jgi:ribose-phosphate pyrophosphokinase
MELSKLKVVQFSDGEFQPYFEESIRGDDVFIIQSTNPSANNLMELLLTIDAAKRASAARVTAVLPYFGWARQDKKDAPRTSIGAKVVANLLQSVGVDRVITCDLHADQEQGFFDIPVDHITSKAVFIPFLREAQIENLMIATPDIGGSKRASTYASLLNCPVLICHKTRTKANEIASMSLIGAAKGKNVVLVDDMVDTAGTLCQAATLIKESGALSVSACITHPVLSGKAYERIYACSALSKLYVTDTINIDNWQDFENKDKIQVLTASAVFANIISKVHSNTSTSENFEF